MEDKMDLIKGMTDFFPRKHKSIWLKNAIAVISLFLIPVLVLNGLLFFYVKKVTEDGIVKECSMQFEQKMAISDTVLHEIKLLALQIMNSQDTMVFIYSGSLSSDQKTEKIINQIIDYSMIFDYIDSIEVYSNVSGKIMSKEHGEIMGDNVVDSDWLLKAQSNTSDYFDIFTRKKKGIYPRLITFMANVIDKKKLGLVSINLNSEKLSSIFDGPNRQGSYYIIDDANIVIYGSDGLMEGKNISEDKLISLATEYRDGFVGILNKQGMNYFAAVKKSSLFDWKYVYLVPEESYKSRIAYVNIMLIYISVIIMLMVVVMGALIVIKTYQPVKKILALVCNPYVPI